MHDSQFRSQPVNIILDISVECLEIQAMLVHSMQHLFLESKQRFMCALAWLLPERLERFDQLGEVFGSKVCNGIKSRRLEVFKAGMVEDLAN